MKIATWNVNSLKVRQQHLLDWLAANPVDVIGLQETKLVDDKFPAAALQEAGYDALFSGQPTYNGVALLYRRDRGIVPEDVIVGNPRFDDAQKRLIAARFGALRIVCGYFPNGQALDSEKYPYKLAWIEGLRTWLAELDADRPGTDRILLGDFNIAPADEDVHDPVAWQGQVLVSEPEREGLRSLLGLGMSDAFRLFEQPPKSFSWWDYRMLGFRRNAGLRIDLILVSEALKPRVKACWIDKAPRRLDKPSDHAPVVVELAWPAAAETARPAATAEIARPPAG